MADKNRKQDERQEGRQRKDNALDLLERTRKAILTAGRRVLLRVALRDGSATADDVRRGVSMPPDIDPVCLGAVPRPLARKGIIKKGGWTTSTRPERHGAMTLKWLVADADAAHDWLDCHPDMPTPPAAIVADAVASGSLLDDDAA